MHLVRTGRSQTRCVAIETLKRNLRVSHTSEDDLMALWIGAAEGLVEARLNRSIMRQSFLLTMDHIAPTATLPRPQVDARPTIKRAFTRDPAGMISLDVSDPLMLVANMLPVLHLPEIARRRDGALVIEYQAGAAIPDEVPPGIRQAVLLIASNWYRTREAAPTDLRARAPTSILPFGADALISQFRIPNVNSDPYDLVYSAAQFSIGEAGGGGGEDGGSGTPGEGALEYYQHIQSAPATTWTIVHNLGFRPNVTTVSSAGGEIRGETQYPSRDVVTVKFNTPAAGMAYLS